MHPVIMLHYGWREVKGDLIILIVKIVSTMYHVFPEKLLVNGLTIRIQ